jgi:hypothetical protein
VDALVWIESPLYSSNVRPVLPAGVQPTSEWLACVVRRVLGRVTGVAFTMMLLRASRALHPIPVLARPFSAAVEATGAGSESFDFRKLDLFNPTEVRSAWSKESGRSK